MYVAYGKLTYVHATRAFVAKRTLYMARLYVVLGTDNRFDTRYLGTRQIPGYPGRA